MSAMDYRAAGVDIDAGSALVQGIAARARAIKRPGQVEAIGGFSALFDLAAAGHKDSMLVATSDGVGTKVKLAAETGKLDGIGIDLVAMCANDLLTRGAEPLFFLDYLAIDRICPERVDKILASIIKGCRLAGCALLGGETAEMPGLYQQGEFDLAGFMIGAVARADIMPRSHNGTHAVIPGDVLIGLEANGPHSNGFSLLRAIRKSGRGKTLHVSDSELDDALLEPTRMYVAGVRAVLSSTIAPAIKAMAHITGGGLPGNIERVLPSYCLAEIDVRNWHLPSIFKHFADCGKISPEEIARVFHLGIGFVLIADHVGKDELMRELVKAGEQPVLIGHVLPRGDEPTSVRMNGLDMSWLRG